MSTTTTFTVGTKFLWDYIPNFGPTVVLAVIGDEVYYAKRSDPGDFGSSDVATLAGLVQVTGSASTGDVGSMLSAVAEEHGCLPWAS